MTRSMAQTQNLVLDCIILCKLFVLEGRLPSKVVLYLLFLLIKLLRLKKTKMLYLLFNCLPECPFLLISFSQNIDITLFKSCEVSKRWFSCHVSDVKFLPCLGGKYILGHLGPYFTNKGFDWPLDRTPTIGEGGTHPFWGGSVRAGQTPVGEAFSYTL